ncbi:MAG TPA: DHH family phosphoesterase [Candidatus Saccharimonadales bacterium]|nr:DHH family phosphoesterase [Candidatus Saccharimonadales bacterium]
MFVVSAGAAYIDIDAYASCIAEAALLNACGEPAYAASSAPLNESIPASFRALDAHLTPYTPRDTDSVIVVDISKESGFDPLVSQGTLVEVIDHHPGQEEYWRARPYVKADIEFIGAACTKIYERWVAAGMLDRMSPAVATLLAAGILDNTLNLQASVTTERDRQAYRRLMDIAQVPDDFAARYFRECQEAITTNVTSALLHDTKTMEEAPALPRTIGQLTLWDGRMFAIQNQTVICQTMSALDADWAVNIISLFDGKSYFVSDSLIAQGKLHALLNVTFTGVVSETDRLWLRKELLNIALG